MPNDNPEGNLESGELPEGGLTPEQLAANRELVLNRFERRFGLGDAGIVNPTLQHSPDHPEQHGF